jgi:hypothetical protein
VHRGPSIGLTAGNAKFTIRCESVGLVGSRASPPLRGSIASVKEIQEDFGK